jgi:phage-related protein
MPSNSAIIGRVAIKVAPDTKDFKDDLQRQLDRIERSTRIVLPTGADLTGATADVRAGIAKIEAASRIELRTTADTSAAAAEVAALKRLSPLRLGVDLDTDSLGRSLAGLANIGASAAKFAAISAAVGGLAVLSLSAASNLAALAVSLASILPAALALPGLLGGFAVGIGTTVAALRDFGQVFPDVAGKLGTLQDLISRNFFEQAQAPIRALIDTLLPQLTAGLGATATALGGFFGSFATAITSTLGPALPNLFAALVESIRVATGGTAALAGVFTTLGNLGAALLPRLAQGFVDVLSRFDAFLAAAAADGRLQGWVETGFTALSDLGSVIASTVGIFGAIGEAAAAAGGTVLGSLAAALDRVQAVVESPAFQTGLTAVFRSAHDALSLIATISGPAVSAFFSSLTTLLPTLLPLLGSALGTALAAVSTALSSVALQQGAVAVFTALDAAVRALSPLLPVLGDVLGNLASIVGGALTTAFNVVGQAVAPVADLFARNESAATAVASVLTAVLVPALTLWAATTVVSAASAVAAFLSAGLAATVQVARVVAALAGAVAATIAWVATTVAQAAVAVASYVLVGTQALIAGARIAAAWLLALGPVGLVIAAVVAAVAVVVANFDRIREIISTAWNAVQRATAAAWDFVTGVVLRGVELITRALLNFTGPGLVVKHWDAITSTVSTGAGKVVEFVRALPGRLVSALGNVGTVLLAAGRSLIEGFVRGITDRFNAVRDTLGNLTSKLTDWKGPESLDRVLLVGAGQLVIRGFLKGLESQYDAVRRSLQGFTRTLSTDTALSGSLLLSGDATGASRSTSEVIGRSLAEGGGAVIDNSRHLTYINNGPVGMSSEEELFTAASRTRMFF